MDLLRPLKRLIGVYERPPDEPAGRPAEDLRNAAQAKSQAAESLRSADRSELTGIADRKEQEAVMLRQLAAEMELTRPTDRS